MEEIKELLTSVENIDLIRNGILVCIILLVVFNSYLLIYLLVKKFRKSPADSRTIKLLIFLKLGFLATVGGVILIDGIFLIAGVSLAASIILPQPKVIYPNSPSLEALEISPENPFKIVFDRPIDSGVLEKTISPELDGTWDFTSTNYPYLTDTLIFVPNVSPAAEGRYTIALKNIKNVAGTNKSEYLLSFMAPPLPTIKSINPKNGTQNFAPDQIVEVETDFPHENLAKLDFQFKPDVEIVVEKTARTKYSIKSKNGFKKSTTYTLEVYRTPVSRDFINDSLKETGESTLISQSNFRTLEAAGVSDYGPKGSGIMTDASVWVEFKQDMDKSSTEKAFSISPKVEGTKSWESNRKLIFKPTSLSKNTTYSINVTKEAKVIDGSGLEESFGYSFITIGHVAVSSFSPSNNSYNVALGANVSVRFNQAVDHASAQSHFSISPNIAGSFSWSGNTLTFTHGNFGYSTRYTVSVGAGVKTVYGLDSVKGYSASFTTKQQSVMLNVPAYRQAHMYSCMASAARSALAYKGKYVGEDHLLSLMGYDRTAFSGTWGNPNSIWGNPYNAIVGNIDGKSGGVNWGYGAYWGPTARAVSSYRPAEIKSGWNVSGIAQEISNGNPVIVWWVNGVWPAYEVYWKTPSGTSIRGVNSMHVQTVKGFTGSISNPTSFTVVDSGYGYPSRTYDVGTFKAKWSWFGNSAVVVR